jgi:hypothetical protein
MNIKRRLAIVCIRSIIASAVLKARDISSEYKTILFDRKFNCGKVMLAYS